MRAVIVQGAGFYGSNVEYFPVTSVKVGQLWEILRARGQHSHDKLGLRDGLQIGDKLLVEKIYAEPYAPKHFIADCSCWGKRHVVGTRWLEQMCRLVD